MGGGDGRVSLVRLGCRKFERISSESLDRELSGAESRYLENHRQACSLCRQAESNRALALNMLRSATVQVEPDETFDRRLIRRARLQEAQNRFSYWSPTAIGAVVALVLVLAIVQVVSIPHRIPENVAPEGEARLTSPNLPSVPDLQQNP
jgi:predicted anti-sigma-YlaC factor YlaD